MKFAAFIFAILCTAPALATEETTASGGTSQTPSSEYELIEAAEGVSLDTFEGIKPGVRLKCETEANGKIAFCETGCEKDDTTRVNPVGPSVSTECASFIDANIEKCVRAMGCRKSVRFCGVGGAAKRTMVIPGKSPDETPPSRHSSGDALDLFGIKCMALPVTFPHGPGQGPEMNREGALEAINLNFHKDIREASMDNRWRYDLFLSCWRQAVAQAQPPKDPSCQGALSCEGSEEPTNKAHNNHIHMSCPIVRKKVSGT